MAVSNDRCTRHDPDIVSGISCNDGTGVVLIKICNDIFRFKRPDKLHTPDCVAGIFNYKPMRVIPLFRFIKSAFVKNESRVYTAVFFELVRFNGVVCPGLKANHSAEQGFVNGVMQKLQ